MSTLVLPRARDYVYDVDVDYCWLARFELCPQGVCEIRKRPNLSEENVFCSVFLHLSSVINMCKIFSFSFFFFLFTLSDGCVHTDTLKLSPSPCLCGSRRHEGALLQKAGRVGQGRPLAVAAVAGVSSAGTSVLPVVFLYRRG